MKKLKVNTKQFRITTFDVLTELFFRMYEIQQDRNIKKCLKCLNNKELKK